MLFVSKGSVQGSHQQWVRTWICRRQSSCGREAVSVISKMKRVRLLRRKLGKQFCRFHRTGEGLGGGCSLPWMGEAATPGSWHMLLFPLKEHSKFFFFNFIILLQ